MTISLQKGQAISLAKTPALSRVSMGLGWDPARAKGFLGRLSTPKSIDLDASVIVFDAGKTDIGSVWFGQKTGMNGAVRHSGDNLTGDGDDEDDETISVDLAALPAEATHLVFTVNSFRGQTFNEVENASCRLLDQDGRETCRFDLSEKGTHTGVIMAVLSRDGAGWKMRAIGTPFNGRTVRDMIGPAKQLLQE
ncbi:tellurium resistance TerZ family protein [Cereibacter sphaeroides]|uniref:TerD family protein n=1 Tax=Cereibacter sphaeroides TaxID=1063 RepID=UPI001F28580D|nr:TerD family protein [Cereibacter sphaeroides]MCE6957755.1 tellurium resistance TerZ family protein [Cereibacter sphaeroides]MCE6971619.1 tellurium resistance TerZ family protein [Cereibacter sphaeroides]